MVARLLCPVITDTSAWEVPAAKAHVMKVLRKEWEENAAASSVEHAPDLTSADLMMSVTDRLSAKGRIVCPCAPVVWPDSCHLSADSAVVGRSALIFRGSGSAGYALTAAI